MNASNSQEHNRKRKTTLNRVLTLAAESVEVVPGQTYAHFGVLSFAKGLFSKAALSGDEIAAARLCRVRAGQFIYGRLNAYEGAFAVVTEEFSGGHVSSEFPVFDCDPSALLPEFLFYYFSRPKIWNELKRLVRGVGGGAGNRRIRLKEKTFLSLRVELPPLVEQRRIVAKIESLAAKIDEAKQLRQAIQADAQAMLRSAFQQIIEGAEYRPMAEVSPVLRRPVKIDLDGEYPELGARSFGRGLFHKPTLIGSELDWQKLYRVHSGDLVFSNIKAWEGAIAVAGTKDHNRVASHRYITCVPQEGVATASFMCFYLLAGEGIEQVRAASPGSADRNRTLAMKRLERINVPVPDYAKQVWFNRLQAKVAAISQTQADNQTELDALLPAILDRAFKGEL